MRSFRDIALSIAALLLPTAAIAEPRADPVPQQTYPSEVWPCLSVLVLRSECEFVGIKSLEVPEIDRKDKSKRLYKITSINSRAGLAPELTVGTRPEIKSLTFADAKELFDLKKYHEAFQALSILSSNNDSAAQCLLGLMYEEGLGVEPSSEEAFRLFRISSEAGFTLSSYYLGVAYTMGRGTRRDYQKAMASYLVAASDNNSYAMNNIGQMYRNGFGVPRDNEKALYWYRRSAGLENSMARQNIADLINLGLAKESDIPIPVTGNHEPDWKRKPTLEQMAAFYPVEALKARVTGLALLSCKVEINGLVSECNIISETPNGYGFGNAALKVVRISEFIPKIVNGVATPGLIRVPMNFQIPAGMMESLLKALSEGN